MLSLTLYKIEDKSVYEYFIHDLQLSLFDAFPLNIVIRINGRIQRIQELTFDTQADRDKKVRELFMMRIKEGYNVRYNLPGKIENLDKINAL